MTDREKPRREKGDLAVYIDLSNLGSSGSVYADTTRSISERATTLLVDVLLALHDELFRNAVKGDGFNLSALGPLIDELADASTKVRVIGPIEEETSFEEKTIDGSTASLSIGTYGNAPMGTAAMGASSTDERKIARREKATGLQKHVVHLPEISSAIKRIVEALAPNRVWILLDEWSNVPLDLQPFLADLLRRSVFHLRGVTVKIGAIEFRSRFLIPQPNGSYLGIEVGADMSADANLDDLMVFDNDDVRASAFHRELIYNHLSEGNDLKLENIDSGEEIVRICFTQDNAFTELVRAAEGVPRDAIHILSLAAQYSVAAKISIPTVRKAAKNWYQTGKATTLRSKDAANRLLEWIKEKVIQHRRAAAFLLESGRTHTLIDELFDSRVIHLIKRGVSSKDTPGVRYDVYKLDYGCYVDLMTTAAAPNCLFHEDDENNSPQLVEVPRDDYRSIRRAILDLDEFDRIEQAR